MDLEKTYPSHPEPLRALSDMKGKGPITDKLERLNCIFGKDQGSMMSISQIEIKHVQIRRCLREIGVRVGSGTLPEKLEKGQDVSIHPGRRDL